MGVSRGLSAVAFATSDGGRFRDRPGDGNVLISLTRGQVSPRALELARTITSGNEAELIVLNPVCLPEQTPLDLSSRFLTEHRETTSAILDTVSEGEQEVPVTGAVHVGHDRLHIIARAVETYDVRVIVVDDSWPEARLSPLTRSPVEKLETAVDCSLVAGGGLPATVSSVLVPVAGGPHSEAAAGIARAIASRHDAWIELLHVVTPGDRATEGSGRGILDTRASSLGEFDSYDTWLLTAENVEDAIVEQSRYYDVTVIGAPRTPRLRRFVFGSTSRTVQENVSNDVVTVWG